MGLCAGLGVLLLQPVESWQGVQALASARVMWLAGYWLLAGILGWGCSLACPTGACWLALAAAGESPDGPQLAPACWQSCGASCSASLAQGQPPWRVASQKRVPPTSVGMLGAQCAWLDALARCSLCR